MIICKTREAQKVVSSSYDTCRAMLYSEGRTKATDEEVLDLILFTLSHNVSEREWNEIDDAIEVRDEFQGMFTEEDIQFVNHYKQTIKRVGK